MTRTEAETFRTGWEDAERLFYDFHEEGVISLYEDRTIKPVVESDRITGESIGKTLGRLLAVYVGDKEGITRNTIIEIAKKELKLRTIQRKVMARELIDADGIFLTGTGAEITPIVNIDGHKVTLGTVTTKLQKLYFDIVNGTNLKYSHWLTSIS